MPGGMHNPALGYLTFVGVKFAGYSIAGRMLSVHYNALERKSLVVGLTRTVIGMAAGVAYVVSWAVIGRMIEGVDASFLIGLLPVRIAEWWLLLWIFYRKSIRGSVKDWGIVGAATVWSYILDIPAVLGFLATAGVWIC
jgi:hypothetical protein